MVNPSPVGIPLGENATFGVYYRWQDGNLYRIGTAAALGAVIEAGNASLHLSGPLHASSQPHDEAALAAFLTNFLENSKPQQLTILGESVQGLGPGTPGTPPQWLVDEVKQIHVSPILQPLDLAEFTGSVELSSLDVQFDQSDVPQGLSSTGRFGPHVQGSFKVNIRMPFRGGLTVSLSYAAACIILFVIVRNS